MSCHQVQRSKHPGHIGMDAAYINANSFRTTAEKLCVLSDSLFHPINTWSSTWPGNLAHSAISGGDGGFSDTR